MPGKQIVESGRTPDAAFALAAIVDSAVAAIVGKSLNGIVTSWNREAERIFGYAADEMIGRPIATLAAPGRGDEMARILARIRTGERVELETERRRKDGRIIEVALTVSPIRDDSGRIIGASKIARDISERRRSERRLQELQGEISHISRLSEMGHMASALAHEVNQPLTAAANYLTAARRLLGSRDAAAQDRAIGAIDGAAAQVTRAAEIVRRLRAFVRKAEGAQQREDMLQVIAEASALALIGVREQGVEVAIRAAPGIGEAMVDKIQIQQVLVNLVRNAVEAMAGSARRELAIDAKPTMDAMIEVGVADTGPGLALDVAARLFQPFVTTKPQGMGVGLSICRTIVEAHGGRLWAEASDGGGTVFRFTIPAAPSPVR